MEFGSERDVLLASGTVAISKVTTLNLLLNQQQSLVFDFDLTSYLGKDVTSRRLSAHCTFDANLHKTRKVDSKTTSYVEYQIPNTSDGYLSTHPHHQQPGYLQPHQDCLNV